MSEKSKKTIYTKRTKNRIKNRKSRNNQKILMRSNPDLLPKVEKMTENLEDFCQAVSFNSRYIPNFLRKHVGRPFDDVYSQLSKKIGKKVYFGLDLMTRVNFEVYTQAEITKTEDTYLHSKYGFPLEDALYVDEDGILCYAKPSPKRPNFNQLPNYSITLINGTYYGYLKNHNGDSHWYELSMEKIPLLTEVVKLVQVANTKTYINKTIKLNQRFNDILFGQVLNDPSILTWLDKYTTADLKKVYGDLLYCVGKKQASTKQIKKIEEYHKIKKEEFEND